jgi:hypothetical protein
MTRISHVAASGIVCVVLGYLFAPLPYLFGTRALLAFAQEPTITANPPPTPAQIRALMARAAENQHRNDAAVEEFERTERVVTRKPGDSSETISDRTDRILPSGTGVMKLQVAENGSPVPGELYRHELQYAVTALELAMHPNERFKEDRVKFEKRRRDRDDLVDSFIRAFRITWAGRETRNGFGGARGSRTLDKFLLEPDPEYKTSNRIAMTFEHVRGALWVDESQAQFARLEGDIASDITFAGGIAGKIYHGGHFVVEQSEVAPGVWLPTLYTYDVDGRKFLFGFAMHERTEISAYRRIGPPSQAIEQIRNELNNLTAQTQK